MKQKLIYLKTLMITKQFHLIITLLLFVSTSGLSQKNYIPDNIKSIKLLSSKSSDSSYPIINFEDQLDLSFDDLDADEKNYYFEINHFDYKWKSSRLLKSEYLIGFDDVRIENYKNSYNTLQSYTHYKLRLSKNDFSFKVSGNYSISIHLSSGEKIFEKRFSIVENLTKMSISISRSNEIKNIESVQNIDVTVNCNNCSKILNNSSILKLVILKNNNWNTSISISKPSYVLNNKIIYQDIVFKGGNEYLSFDTSNIISKNYRIHKTELKNLYNNYLINDLERTNKKYVYNPDKNGSYMLNSMFSDFDIENDYSNVHFTLIPNFIDLESKVYIIGEFNNFNPNKNHELTLKGNKFKGNFKFKQGYYNYTYCYKSSTNPGKINYFRGEFWQTENLYSALLYEKKLNDKYFKLIGHSSISSSIIKN